MLPIGATLLHLPCLSPGLGHGVQDPMRACLGFSEFRLGGTFVASVWLRWVSVFECLSPGGPFLLLFL